MTIKLAIAYSLRDPAGAGTAARIIDYMGADTSECPKANRCHVTPSGVMIGGFTEDTINFEFLDETPDPSADAVIVLSRHSATSGRPSLTTHHTGNPTGRTLGGSPYTLAWSAPPLSKTLLLRYREAAEARGLLGEYEVTLEATHHGPTGNRKPLVFIEIGSTPDRWRDPRAQEAMALAVIETLEKGLVECTPAAGFGEPHYPIKFTKIHLETEYCMGHIIPKYALPETTREVVSQAINKTWPTLPKTTFVQKKAAKASIRNRIIQWLQEIGIEVEVL
ncbi:MAG: D-aminoacyl-tRNA deacylase [Desulfurococcales archaeon]|nr:D-aminoacyl-tRNA deacylase [Desulfurococcales archaeon]